MQAGLDFLDESEDSRTQQDTFSTIDASGGRRSAKVVDESDGQPFGKYVLLDELARGGMGVVYRAKQLSLNRIVALKTVLAGHLASTADLERFRIEAETVGQLTHPGIVRVHEAGEQDGIRYLCMDFVEGTSLAAQIADGPLAAEDAARMMQLIAEAVAHAHEHGVIHRDLKPANVLLDASGQPKVTDFGLAKRIDSVSDLTQTGQILGTASYMSPEQASGEAINVGPATDVYSCGAMLYAMLTGRPPFQSANPLETIRQVAVDEPVAPSQLAPDIPRDLETICLRCLQKMPNRRYESASDLAHDLGRFLAGRPVLARPVSKAERLLRWSQRNPIIARLVAALSISVLAGLLAVTILWLRAEDTAGQLAESLDAEREAKQSALDSRNAAVKAQQEAEQQTLAASRRLLQANCSEVQRLLEAPVPGRVAKMQTALRESVELLNVT